MMNIFCKFFSTYSNRIIFLLGLLYLTCAVQAQEFLTGLRTNPQIIKIFETQPLPKSKGENTPLLLPFFEDFSNYTGYPNENLFIDKQAFVNNTFAVYPPTIGVVTLDALNEKGEIYPHLNMSSKGADTLTSRFIRLDSLFIGGVVKEITLEDSLYFSFYFQPGGGGVAGVGAESFIGNQPNKNDSLVLEFGYTIDSLTVWKHIWSTPGFNISQWTSENPLKYFEQVLIPITDKKYLCDRFQFRFRNYASLEPRQGISGWEGNVDQWHIDYIRLDVDRSYQDVFTNDLAFVNPTTSFLDKYQAMPWKQYHPADRKARFHNDLTNLSSGTRAATYKYMVTQNGNAVYEYIAPGTIDVFSYSDHGLHNNEIKQTDPEILFTPTLTDTATVKITHVFQNVGGLDFCTANDTCVHEQKFYNYYAYDDGTAEYGYCLNNQYNIAFLAMKFSIRVPDSLCGIQMWFNHTKNDENSEALFNFMIWEDDNGQPGDTIYTSEANKPEFANKFWNFVEYPLERKILVSGDIWVGFEQQGNVQLNIGFDQNTDSREFFKFNTLGIWETSVFKGTPMMRPVLGESLKLSINCCEKPVSKTMIAPNPTTGELRVTSYELRVTSIEVFDVFGRNVSSHHLIPSSSHQINVSHLPSGIYFVRILKENNTFETHKVIKN
jgi:hypothetical protein